MMAKRTFCQAQTTTPRCLNKDYRSHLDTAIQRKVASNPKIAKTFT